MLLIASQQTARLHKKYKLISFCTPDNIIEFKLDPPKGSKVQPALISVTGLIDNHTDSAGPPVYSLLVDDVPLLSIAQANALKPILVKMLYFGAIAGQIARKRTREPWIPGENTARSSTCRALGRSPTGPSLPDYASSASASL